MNIELDVKFETNQDFNCGFDGGNNFNCDFEGLVAANYEGSYNVTPTEQTQILVTAGKTLSQNVKVDPIPNNYGLITWDGSKLTVS